jgi:acetyltransferase-like isoleucine patch superfamily enzyme
VARRWLVWLAINPVANHEVLPPMAGCWLYRWWLYRWLGVRIRDARIRPRCVIDGDPRLVTIGDGTFINRECVFEVNTPFTIAPPPRPDERRARAGLVASQVLLPVTIEDPVVIHARATVLPGVTIGAGTIVAAGAVVPHDLEPWSCYAGVPARKVRSLTPVPGLL